MTVLAQNLKTIRKNLNCTQMAISDVLEIGFRTYVRYEAGERDAPVAVLVKLARLGNISLDRLLITPMTLEDLKTPDVEKTPSTPRKMEVISGGLEEGRIVFKGLRNDHLITTDKSEKNLLIEYRKLNRTGRDKCVLDAEWILNNPRTFRRKKTLNTSSKAQKAKNAQRLKQMAKSIKKTTLRG
jgi:transcriptional regulator with XRE-family HTH domain